MEAGAPESTSHSLLGSTSLWLRKDGSLDVCYSYLSPNMSWSDRWFRIYVI